MKRSLFLFVCLLMFLPLTVEARGNNERITVTLDRCIDGDTARFFINGESISVRFLAIDAPEITGGQNEPFGQESSDFACDRLTYANLLELEYEYGRRKTDRFDRHLAWIFVDGNLLQKELLERGYAHTAFLDGVNEYVHELKEIERRAQQEQVGIWGDYVLEPDYTMYYIIGGIILLIVIGFILPRVSNKTARRAVRRQNTKVRRKVRSNIRNIRK